jgi:hypothetical protein
MQSWNTLGKVVSEIVKASCIHPSRETHITIERGGQVTTATFDRPSENYGRAHPLAFVSNTIHRLYGREAEAL